MMGSEARTLKGKLIASVLVVGGSLCLTELRGLGSVAGGMFTVAGFAGSLDKDGFVAGWVSLAAMTFAVLWIIVRLICSLTFA